MFYSDVIDMLCLYIQQSLFDLLQNSINELLCSYTIMRQHTVVLYELYEKFWNFKELNVMKLYRYLLYWIGLQTTIQPRQ